MSKRLTIMYRAGITTERASHLISANDASIVCWDDVFAERAALAQRCRELEGELQRNTFRQQSDEAAYSVVVQQNDTLRAEVERCAEIAAQNASDAGALYAEVETLRKDAERYRWLRNHGATCRWEEGDTEVCNHPGLLDEAVDESIAKAKGGEE